MYEEDTRVSAACSARGASSKCGNVSLAAHKVLNTQSQGPAELRDRAVRLLVFTSALYLAIGSADQSEEAGLEASKVVTAGAPADPPAGPTLGVHPATGCPLWSARPFANGVMCAVKVESRCSQEGGGEAAWGEHS